MDLPPFALPAIPADRAARAAARLPSMSPVEGRWLTRDAAFAGQLSLKAEAMAARRPLVAQVRPGAEPAVAELLETVLEALAEDPGYRVAADEVCRPDGVGIAVDRSDPLLTLSRLVQEDLCVMERQGEEHVLTAALLCFPAAWTLAEKIGRPLTRIHAPVPPYDAGIAARVQRLFDGARPGRPMWRANLLRYDDPAPFQPHVEARPRPVGRPDSPWLRSERQTVLRLPGTGAAVFAIHTAIAPAPTVRSA